MDMLTSLQLRDATYTE